MDLDEMFTKDTDTERECGTCGQVKPLSDFYKDGTTSTGQTKYRRDCKDCYKRTRMQTIKQRSGKHAVN